MNPRREAAFAWVEVLVALFVLGTLVLLISPGFQGGCMVKGVETQMLSNMRQLHLATISMELDRSTSGDAKIGGWPGDTGGTFTNWARQLVPTYLSTNDFCKLLSSPGKIVPPDALPAAMSESAVLIYAVSTNSPDTAVFLSSAHFTNSPNGGAPLDKSAKPFGNKNFVVFRKGGDGSILLPKQVGMTNIIGSYVPLLK